MVSSLLGCFIANKMLTINHVWPDGSSPRMIPSDMVSFFGNADFKLGQQRSPCFSVSSPFRYRPGSGVLRLRPAGLKLATLEALWHARSGLPYAPRQSNHTSAFRSSCPGFMRGYEEDIAGLGSYGRLLTVLITDAVREDIEEDTDEDDNYIERWEKGIFRPRK